MGFYKKYSSAGLCGNCGKEPRPGKTTCEECYLKKSTYDISRKAALKEAKICISCAKKPALEGVRCGNCERRMYESSSEWPSNDPEYKMNAYLVKTYGITLQDKKDMLRNQNYTCAIEKCNEAVGLSAHTDHDHATGKLREILCQKCNQMIGLARENVAILQSAIHYLNKHKGEGL